MRESDKTRIVLASVLKPIDDTRMYNKIGLTLAQSGKYDVHVMGRGSERSERADITQHSLGRFGRISVGRLLAPWRILSRTFRLKPDVFIITTHELLFVAMFVKAATKCRVVYDVQENYYWNILYTPAFPLLIKPFVALYVRGKEILTARFVDHFFLAERGYLTEIHFPNGRSTILENKMRHAGTPERERGPARLRTTINLLFSGTIAETTGVFTAIELAIKLHVIDERFRLTIIGHAAQKHVLEKIRLLIRPRGFIQLIARDSPVPYSEVLQHLSKADFGLITYQINPSTMNATPTKLYEYVGMKLPILLVPHKPWIEFCVPYNAAVVFDPNDYDAAVIYEQMMQETFYTTEPTEVYWESEEDKLLEVVEGLSPHSPA